MQHNITSCPPPSPPAASRLNFISVFFFLPASPRPPERGHFSSFFFFLSCFSRSHSLFQLASPPASKIRSRPPLVAASCINGDLLRVQTDESLCGGKTKCFGRCCRDRNRSRFLSAPSTFISALLFRPSPLAPPPFIPGTPGVRLLDTVGLLSPTVSLTAPFTSPGVCVNVESVNPSTSRVALSFIHQYKCSAPLDSDEPDGRFPKSFGFLSGIHLERSPERVR